MVGNNIRRERPVDDHTSVVLRKCPPMADYYTLKHMKIPEDTQELHTSANLRKFMKIYNGLITGEGGGMQTIGIGRLVVLFLGFS